MGPDHELAEPAGDGEPGAGTTAAQRVLERRECHLVGQATGVLMERHQVGAEAALECLLTTAREGRVDTRTAAVRVIASIGNPHAAPVVAPLDVLLRHIPRSLVAVRPVALHLAPTADRPLVQLRYDTDDPNSATGAAAFVALRGPAPAAGPATYELVDPRVPLLAEPELFAPFRAGRGLRWVRAQDRRTRLLWGDAESIVDAVSDLATATRAAAHLGCVLVGPGADAN